MYLMGMPLWAWIVLYVLVLLMNEYINDIGSLLGMNLNMPLIEVPTPVSLAVIFGVLVLSMLLSVVVTKRKH